EGVAGVEFQGLLERALGLLPPVQLVEQLRLAAPGLGVGRVLGQDLVHGPQGGLVLAVGVLLEGLVDLDVDRLAAPLEFLAAAARAGGVGFAGHTGLLFVKAPARGRAWGPGKQTGGPTPPARFVPWSTRRHGLNRTTRQGT